MWFVLAIIASWLYCVALEINKRYPFDGILIVSWRCLVGAVGMLVCLPFMFWPTDPMYYVVVVVSAIASVWGMGIQCDLAAKHNGRVANLQQPICIVATFVAWLFLDYQELNRLLTDYVYAAGVLGSLTLMIVSLQFMRQNDASWAILRRIFPVGIVYAGLWVVAKIFLDTGAPSLGISLNWVFLGSFCIFLSGVVVLLKTHGFSRAALMPKGVVPAAIWGGVFYTVSWTFSAVAIIYAANPAYPSVVAALAPLWFAVYYTVFGIKDDFSPIAGLFLGLSAILLLLVTI